VPELLCSFNGIGGIALILTKSEIKIGNYLKVFGHKYDVCKQIGKGSIILLGGSDDVKEARRVFLDECRKPVDLYT